MSERTIADDEVLYRRIPPGSPWFEPPDRISSANFKLRRGELGISVYRAAAVDVAGVLNKPEAVAESRVAKVTAGQIRDVRNGKGNPLGLDVVAVNDEDNPGHCEIRGPSLKNHPKTAAKALKKLFKLVESPSEGP